MQYNFYSLYLYTGIYQQDFRMLLSNSTAEYWSNIQIRKLQLHLQQMA